MENKTEVELNAYRDLREIELAKRTLEIQQAEINRTFKKGLNQLRKAALDVESELDNGFDDQLITVPAQENRSPEIKILIKDPRLENIVGDA